MCSHVLLERSLTLTSENEKTNIVIPFRVDEPYDEIYVDTCFYPKYFYDYVQSEQMIEECVQRYQLDPQTDVYEGGDEVLPLCNHVTFSMDMNGKYIGSALRHGNAQHIVLKSGGSSPGFSLAELESGEWKFVINVFALITTKCDYQVQITGIRR